MQKELKTALPFLAVFLAGMLFGVYFFSYIYLVQIVSH
jgi:hypothetical protein